MAVDVGNRHPTTRGLFPVDDKAPAFERGLQVAAFIDNSLGLAEQITHVARHLTAGLGVWAVDLGDHSLQDGRSGWHFDDLDAGTHLLCDRRQHLARQIGQLRRRARTFAFGDQLHLNVAIPRLVAQIRVADQTVEIERACSARIGLHGHDLGQAHHTFREARGHVRGDRQRRSRGHVDGHVELGLVVLGQHLDRNAFGGEHVEAAEKNQQQARGEQPSLQATVQKRHQDIPIECIQPLRLTVLAQTRLFQMRHWRANTLGQPRRENEGGKQREQHGHRAQRRNRLHIGAHHPRHKAHRQQRRNHGKGRQHRGVAHLAHRVDAAISGTFPLQQPSPVDVFNHDDRIIDQNSDGKDQCKQTDPVDGIAQQKGGKDGDKDHDRDHHQNHRRRPQSQRQPDQHGHRAGHDKQLEDQLVDLLVGGNTVVASHLDMDIIRDQTALQALDIGQNVIGHRHPVRAGLLGHRNGDRRGPDWRQLRARGCIGQAHMGACPIGRAGVIRDDILGFRGAVGDQRHVAHIGRAALTDANHQVLDVLRIA